MSISSLIKESFSGVKFTSATIKAAANKLQNNGENEAKQYLQEQLDKNGSNPYNAQPPAKCIIIAKSRDFSEWPIVKCSQNIQKYVRELSKSDREKFDLKLLSSKDEHENFFNSTGIDSCNYSNVQGINLIIKHAFNRWDGVEKKINNRNEKNAEKCKKKNIEFIPEPVFGADGKFIKKTDKDGNLINPLGINQNIYCYQSATKTPYSSDLQLCQELSGYTRDPSTPIGYGIPANRLDIPKGQPGYIPDHQRDKLIDRKGKRRRKGFGNKNVSTVNKLQSSLLVAVIIKSKIGDEIVNDWVVFDARGLLRNAKYRGLADHKISLNDLMKLFTGDPVISPARNVGEKDIITFLYKENTVQVHKKKIISQKRAQDYINKTLGIGKTCAIISIDLGQTNPVAAAVYTVKKSNNGLEKIFVKSGLMGECILAKDNHSFKEQLNTDKKNVIDPLRALVQKYRDDYDLIEEEFKSLAVKELAQDQYSEYVDYSDSIKTAEYTRNKICEELNIDATLVPWHKMSPNSTYISDACKDKSKTVFTFKRGNKTETATVKDKKWAYDFSPKLSSETRATLNNLIWQKKRESSVFNAFAKRKQELCRHIVNAIYAWGKEISGCDVIIPCIENLEIKNFHGSGKREVGWNYFFKPKKENRWFIQAMHKAFSELPHNKGIQVFEIWPSYTSQTCPVPDCRHIDSKSRNGEDFKCTKCGANYHADKDVATFNIAEVAITGKVLKIERLSTEKKTVDARKSNKSKKRKDKKALLGVAK